MRHPTIGHASRPAAAAAIGFRGAFAERCSIFSGEAAEFIEAEARRDLGHAFRACPGRQQRFSGLGQPHRMQVAARRDAVDCLERPLEGALADVDCFTDIGNAIELSEARACDLLETINDVLIALPPPNGR